MTMNKIYSNSLVPKITIPKSIFITYDFATRLHTCRETLIDSHTNIKQQLVTLLSKHLFIYLSIQQDFNFFAFMQSLLMFCFDMNMFTCLVHFCAYVLPYLCVCVNIFFFILILVYALVLAAIFIQILFRYNIFIMYLHWLSLDLYVYTDYLLTRFFLQNVFTHT